METNQTHEENQRCMLGFLFESDKFGARNYAIGSFEALVKGGELLNNGCKVVVSAGDIVRMERNCDISPFIIHDDLCTIRKNRVTDFPFAFVMEDITTRTARRLDARLKKECPQYLGMTSVDPESQDAKKRFWKDLIRSFSIEENVLTCFGREEDGSVYDETAEEYGFQVRYDGFFVDYNFVRGSDADLYSTRQSSFITRGNQL